MLKTMFPLLLTVALLGCGGGGSGGGNTVATQPITLSDLETVDWTDDATAVMAGQILGSTNDRDGTSKTLESLVDFRKIDGGVSLSITDVDLPYSGETINLEYDSIQVQGSVPYRFFTGSFNAPQQVTNNEISYTGFLYVSDVPNAGEKYVVEFNLGVKETSQVGTLNARYADVIRGFAGFRTPTSSIPTGTASYSGTYRPVVNQSVDDWHTGAIGSGLLSNGTFTATVDFDAGSISGVMPNGYSTDGSFTATVSGNRFSGTLTDVYHSGNALQTPQPISVPLTGGFFGPDAEEIAGTFSGTDTYYGSTISLDGTFIGSKTP